MTAREERIIKAAQLLKDATLEEERARLRFFDNVKSAEAVPLYMEWSIARAVRRLAWLTFREEAFGE